MEANNACDCNQTKFWSIELRSFSHACFAVRVGGNKAHWRSGSFIAVYISLKIGGRENNAANSVCTVTERSSRSSQCAMKYPGEAAGGRL